MARISMPNFGNAVARPGPVAAPNLNAAAAVGNALAGVGAAAQRTADVTINQQEQERKQAEREAQQEAKQTAREADRVRALTTTATVQNGLADLSAQIDTDMRENRLDRNSAQALFQEKSEALKADALAKVSPEHRDLVSATLLDNMGAARRGIDKMVADRNREDVKAGGLQFFEEQQRYAARGPQQADEAIEKVRTFWTATHASAGEDAAAAQARVQKFAESVRARQATDLVTADPRAALKALKDKNYLPELDPDRRAALVQNADATILRQQQRAEIQAQANERKAKQEWEAISTVIQAGKKLEPEYAEAAAKRFKGTAYEGALKAAMSEAPAQAAFATQPLAQQQASLLSMQSSMNRGGATPEQVKAYERADAAHKAAIKDIKEDPYKAATERGVVESVQPLKIDLATLPQQLAARGEQARVVSQWAGQDVSLFRPEEAAKLGDILTAMPAKDRAGALSAISKSMSPGQMRAFATQLGAKDETLASAALYTARDAKTTSGRNVGELVMNGSDAMKEGRIKWPAGQAENVVRQEIDTEVRGAFLSDNARRAATDAAVAIYASQLADGKSGDVKQAVRLATGGVMDVNGQKIVKPWGWDDGRVLKSLRSFDAPKIEATAEGGLMVGGKPVSAADVAKHLPDAQLGPAPRSGSYTVNIGGRMVTDSKGRPWLLPLEAADVR